MSRSRIEWVTDTWNPVVGCSRESPGCDNCYAEAMARRLRAMGSPEYRDGFAVREVPQRLWEPMRWPAAQPRRCLWPSMGDLLHGGVTPTHVAACLAVAGVASRQGHDMMLLTKRPRRLLRLLRDFGPQEAADVAVRVLSEHGDLDMVHRYLLAQAGDGPWPPQGRYGVSVEDQERADQRVPALAGVQVGRERRFLSVEPLLGPLDMTGHMSAVGWVAVGCETGPNRRPCDLEWIESVVDQCRAAGVRVFVKKVDLGGKGPTGEHGYPREEPPAVAAGG